MNKNILVVLMVPISRSCQKCPSTGSAIPEQLMRRTARALKANGRPPGRQIMKSGLEITKFRAHSIQSAWYSAQSKWSEERMLAHGM